MYHVNLGTLEKEESEMVHNVPQTCLDITPQEAENGSPDILRKQGAVNLGEWKEDRETRRAESMQQGQEISWGGNSDSKGESWV